MEENHKVFPVVNKLLPLFGIHSTEEFQIIMATSQESIKPAVLIESGGVETLDIPVDCVEKTGGFGFDYGGSVTKVAYSEEVKGKLRVHFASFPQHQRDEALKLIQDKVGTKLQHGQEVFLTGVRMNKEKDLVERMLNIKYLPCFEIHCIVEGFQFLTKYFSLRELIYPVTQKIREFQKIFHQADLYASCSNYPEGHTRKFVEYDLDLVPDSVEYPALVFILGSCGVALNVHVDGHFEFIDCFYPGGCALLGLGSLTTNSQSYEELVTLAESGDISKVDVMLSQLIEKDVEDGYGDLTVDPRMTCFPLAHAFRKTKEDFQREDLAAAMVAHVSNYLAVWAQLKSAALRAKHVYFCGSFYNSDFLRQEVHKWFAWRACGDPVVTYAHFLKLGGYFGALGCLLKNLNMKE